MLKMMKGIRVPCDTEPETVAAMAEGMFNTPAITFSDHELPDLATQIKSMCLTVQMNGTPISGVMIDTGAAINVCRVGTLVRGKCSLDGSEAICNENILV